MKILDQGHRYLLNSMDGDIGLTLQFVKREGEKFPGNIGHYSGTNCQEVLRALIDRVKYLDNQISCAENQIALNGLRSVLYAFELRAARRHGRELKTSINRIEEIPFCTKCGHIECDKCV